MLENVVVLVVVDNCDVLAVFALVFVLVRRLCGGDGGSVLDVQRL